MAQIQAVRSWRPIFFYDFLLLELTISQSRNRPGWPVNFFETSSCNSWRCSLSSMLTSSTFFSDNCLSCRLDFKFRNVSPWVQFWPKHYTGDHAESTFTLSHKLSVILESHVHLCAWMTWLIYKNGTTRIKQQTIKQVCPYSSKPEQQYECNSSKSLVL